MRMLMNRTLGVSLLAGSLALSLSANAAEGLYSADDLMDAEVYDSNGEEVGEVEDILLGDDMSLHSIVIETGGVLGLGGREVVAERGSFTVKQQKGRANFKDTEFEVRMSDDKDSVKDLPEYDEGWWNQTRQGLSQAWENTQDTSATLWEDTKEATAAGWRNVRQGAADLGEETEEATHEAAEETEEATDETEREMEGTR